MSRSENIKLITRELQNVGIIDSRLINSALAVIGKESDLTPQTENLKYTAQRIREVFPSIPKAIADKLANNPVALANYVYTAKPYGMRSVSDSYGNTAQGSGNLYKGRGFIQLTFKNLYKKYGDLIGVDLVNNPELANRTDIAAKIAAVYLKETLNNNKNLIKQRYKIDINNLGAADPYQVLLAVTNAVAGFGKSGQYINDQAEKAIKYWNKLQGNKSYFLPSKVGIGLGSLLIGGLLIYILSRR